MDWVAWSGVLVLLGSIPLLVQYRPTLPERALKHPLRKQIMDTLRARPMSSKQALLVRIGCAPGQLDHHLRVLRQCEFIGVLRVGRYTRYFVCESHAENAKAIGVLRGREEMNLARQILTRPGMVQQDLAGKVSMNRKVIRSYLDRLVEAGLVREEIVGKCHVYHPERALPDLMDVVESTRERDILDVAARKL